MPYTERGDEVGAIAKATEVFKQSIAQKVVNFRVRCALDVVRSGVMLADDDYKILYMNGALNEIMDECAPELRKVAAGFRPRQDRRQCDGSLPQGSGASAQGAG